ncbi:hypothetical protein JNB11_07160 [Kocuria palustris]|nr:hypothetical protein [Kocuria palustris]
MSAEAITRYLRSKGDVNDICNQARRLVNAELEVTIPDATGFVLTLFCDRLNESQSKWRLKPEVWKTLGELWDKLTILQRLRIAKRLKIVEILTNVIAEGDINVFQPMFEFMDKVVTKEYIAIDENQAISLLSVFTKCQVLEPLWVQVITALYQLHTTDVTYLQMSKKLYTKFITSCMLSIVLLNVKDNNKPFLQIFRDVICLDNFASQFLTIWQKENLINQFSSETLNYLFELLISHFQLIDVSFCESLYRNFTTNNESNDESLLEILCRTQRPLSYQFFKDIYQREVKRPQLNINMIQYLFSLDVELAIEHASEIMHCVDQEAGTKLIPVITEAFVKGREANDFLLKVWPQAAEHAKWWYADAITNQVSKFINDLTVRQLTSLMPELNDAVFTCVLEGLNDSGYQKIASVKEAVIGRVKNPDWKTIFMILCLYPEEKSNLKFPKFTTEPYCLWSNCRMIEIGASVENLNKMKSGLILILESNLAFVLNRWLPVAEYLGVSKEVVDLLFKLPVDDIRHQLQHAGSIIFELHNLTSAIVDAIIEHKLDELYTIIPPQAISKRQRRHAVENLSNIVTSTYSKPAVKALHHLLAIDATLQSPIESNFSNLLLLLKNSEGDYINELFALAQRIWNEHLRQMANQSCKVYVENAIDQLQDHEGQNQITPELRMTMVVLSASSVPEELSPRIRRLSLKFEKAIHELLRKSESLDDETKAWLLWGLSLTSDPDVEEIIKTIKCLGTSTSSAVRRSLFRLVTKVYPTEIKDVVYILALFYSLTSQGVEDLTEDLSEYLSKTTDAVLTATVNFIVYSMSEICLENSEVFANIVKGLLSQITKSTNDGQAAVSVLFLAVIQGTNQMTPKALEIVLEAINSALIHRSWLFDQYTLEQVLLLVSKVSNILQLSRETEAESCYLKAIRVISLIVLLHRYRLLQRHHLLIASLTSLLVPLSVVRNRATTLSESRIAGESFARLLLNICEVKAITLNDTLTSEAALIKKELRKHLPVFMATYIHYSLKHNFREVVQQQLLPGIFTIFDLMSSTEMQLVNSTLDNLGKVYFKRLYNQYQDQGKWKDA